MEIKIEDYLSREEIKEILEDQIRESIKDKFTNEKEFERILFNLSYEFVYQEIDKATGKNSRELILKKTESILNNIKNYSVFRDGSYGSPKSLAYKILEGAVANNTELIKQKVRECILSKDFSKEVWDQFISSQESFLSAIYEVRDQIK